MLRSPPIPALPGVAGLGRLVPGAAGMLPGARARAVDADPCRLGERSCGAEGAKRAVPAREINSVLYVPLSRRLGSIPMELGLSCGRWLAPPRHPRAWHPGTATARGRCWPRWGARWEGRPLPVVLWGQGGQAAGVGRGLGAAGGGAWRWFPPAGSSIPPARRQWLRQEAPLMVRQEPGAFLKTTSPVKSLLFLICGCRSQSCQGWRWGGAGTMPRAGSASRSWHQPQLSRQGLLPARDVGGGGVFPTPRADPGVGETPVLRQGAHPWLHPMCTPRNPGWGRGVGRGQQAVAPASSQQGSATVPLQPTPLPTQGVSLTFPPELYLMSHFQPIFTLGKSWTRCSSPALPCLVPAQPLVFIHLLLPLLLCRAECAPRRGGLTGAPSASHRAPGTAGPALARAWRGSGVPCGTQRSIISPGAWHGCGCGGCPAMPRLGWGWQH